MDAGRQRGRLAARPATGPFNEQQLRELRDQCRRLAATNEFAINGHENRISYIVGPGHSYRAAVCKGMDAPADVPMQVQKAARRVSARESLARSASRRSSAASIATAKRFCGSSSITPG